MTMSEFTQTPVSAVVWPWPLAAGTPSAVHVANAALRRQAAVRGAVAVTIGCILSVFAATRHLGVVIAGVGGAVGLLGVALPPAFARLDAGLHVFGRWVGVALSWVLLVPFFILVMCFGRLVLTLRARDPLRRGREPDRASYWDDAPAPVGAVRYRNQY